MIKLLDCTEELTLKLQETFGDWYTKSKYNNDGTYDVALSGEYYTFNVTVHSQFITITRVPMAGSTSDDTMATMSFNTDDFWRLEVI